MSTKNQKSKLYRILQYLEAERNMKKLQIDNQRKLLDDANRVREELDHIDQSNDKFWSIFLEYRVKYRQSLERKIAIMSHEIEELIQGLSNIEKTSGQVTQRLQKIRDFETLKEAEIQLSEFVARRRAKFSSALGKPGELSSSKPEKDF
jgi:hypothetical protein